MWHSNYFESWFHQKVSIMYIIVSATQKSIKILIFYANICYFCVHIKSCSPNSNNLAINNNDFTWKQLNERLTYSTVSNSNCTSGRRDRNCAYNHNEIPTLTCNLVTCSAQRKQSNCSSNFHLLCIQSSIYQTCFSDRAPFNIPFNNCTGTGCTMCDYISSTAVGVVSIS